jgi:hypothetical protein
MSDYLCLICEHAEAINPVNKLVICPARSGLRFPFQVTCDKFKPKEPK